MNIKERANQVIKSLEDQGETHDIWWCLPYTLISAAAVYFEECPEDFCVQNTSDRAVVFGGTNRLIFTHSGGFSADPNYCTEKFLHHYEKLGRLPRRDIV